MKRAVRWTLFFGILTLIAVLVIFENSLQSRLSSSQRSGTVLALLLPLLRRIPWIPRRAYHRLIRKAAHMIEFAALGFSLTGLCFALPGKRTPRRCAGMAAAALLIAMLDETIQLFTGRSGSVLDVLLDFSGALCGLLLAMACRKLWKLCHKRHRPTEVDK